MSGVLPTNAPNTPKQDFWYTYAANTTILSGVVVKALRY